MLSSSRAFSSGASALFAAAFCTLAAAQRHAATDARAEAAWQRLPAGFVANRGQWDARIRFATGRAAARTWLATDGLWVAAETRDLGAALRFSFAGAGGEAAGADPQPGVRHFLREGGSITDVPVHARVVHRELYPGTDLVLRDGGGHVAYDLVLAPDADLSQIEVLVSGHGHMRLLPDGSLAFATAVGELRQTPPTTWCTDPAGRRTPLPSRFVLRGRDRYGFQVDGWQHGRLTIDPGLIWGSFLGDTGLDRCTAAGVDTTGRAVIAGTTTSNNFPTTPGSYRPSAQGGTDAFVALFNAAGDGLVFCTYLGGSGDETLDDLQVLADDRVAVSGSTSSAGFPVTADRFQAALSGGANDGYVTILTASGAALNYSSYYGGVGEQTDVHVFVKPGGNICLAGRTTGSAPTTPNAYQASRNGSLPDVFVGELDRSNPGSTSLRYGSYFGGTGDEEAVHSLSVDANNIATVGLTTRSTDCSVSASYFQNSLPGTAPAGYILCFQTWNGGAPTGPQSFVYGSYFGMPGGSTRELMVEVDSSGFFVCVATTSANTWATSPISAQQNSGGGEDVILCRFDAGATGPGAVLLATYYGGSGDESVRDMTFQFVSGTTELVTMVGTTTSNNLPVTGSALQGAPLGTGGRSFVAQIDFRAPGLLMRRYSSYFDGCDPGAEELLGVGWDSANGRITVAGTSDAPLVPGTFGGFQKTPGGGSEGMAAQLDTVAQPAAFRTFGLGCGAPGFVPSFAAGTPPRMCQQFSCTVNNLRPNSAGIMLMGLSNTSWLGGIPLPRDLAPQGMPGCNQLVSTDATFVLFHAGTSVPFGFLVPGSMLFYDFDLYLQFLEIDPAATPAGFAVSNGAALNIQY